MIHHVCMHDAYTDQTLGLHLFYSRQLEHRHRTKFSYLSDFTFQDHFTDTHPSVTVRTLWCLPCQRYFSVFIQSCCVVSTHFMVLLVIAYDLIHSVCAYTYRDDSFISQLCSRKFSVADMLLMLADLHTILLPPATSKTYK